jgi:hypothetical protein
LILHRDETLEKKYSIKFSPFKRTGTIIPEKCRGNSWVGEIWRALSYSPKFRHGHAVYALKLTKDIAELKAVSQNLMHANLSTTDGIYGMLSEMDVKRQIEGLNLEN